MYIKKKYSLPDMLLWTRWETGLFLLYAAVITILFQVVGCHWLHLPWTPIGLVGIAVAFLIGFQSNAAYDRIWEARKIWGGVVNYSRSWTMMIKDMVTNERANNPVSEEELYHEKQTFVHRHIAWMTAFRHAMRQEKPWEVFRKHRTNREWSDSMYIPELEHSLEDDLRPLLSETEYEYVLSKTNKAATLLSLQSGHLRRLKEQGLIWEFAFLKLEGILEEFFNLQGKSERIKNFPYPRHFATLGYYFVNVFIILLPLGIVPEFAKIGEALIGDYPIVGEYFVWAAIPFTAIVSWIFHTMQRIGVTGENPFEGSANDVPISTIARGIEIDIREMIDEPKEEIPAQFPALRDVQM